jgi:histidine triad (HIT) family protein
MGNQPASDAAPDTIFGKIGRGEIPCSDTVYEDETTLAFRDLNPQSPVHIIVIPKLRNGLTGLRNASPSQEGVLGHLLFVAGQVGKVHCPDGFRIVINDGKEGSQSVYHLHLHVLGGRQMQWPPG